MKNTLALRWTLFLSLIMLSVPVLAKAGPLNSNGKIAFTSDRDGNQEIYLMNNDGSLQVRLTNNSGIDNFPTFSPDGRKIVFVSQNTAGQFAIRVMNADGNDQGLITTINFDASPYTWHEKWSMSWSPDSSKIAFEEGGEIFTVNISNGLRTNLTNHPAIDYEPSWSADGSHIVFASSRAFWIRLHTMKADGGDVRELPTGGEAWDMSPDWAPDGSKIAFVAHSESDLPAIYTADADGTNRKIFDACVGGCSDHRNKPKWSPDASMIVFQMWEYFSNDCEIFVKNIDGSGITQLTMSGGRNFQPSWQPLIAPRASVAGRVLTPDGRVLRNALVTLTDASGAARNVTTTSFGQYIFTDVPTGAAYTLSASSRRYRFASRTLTLNGDLNALDLIGSE